MHVGVVAYEMEGQSTGVGRYLAGLLTGVAEVAPPSRWTLFFHGGRFEHELFDDPAFEPVFAGRTGRAPVWEQFALPALLARAGVDLVFSPSYSLPPAPVPGVVTVHDLSFELRGGEFGFRERWRRRLLARRACRRAARVLADTPAILRQLVERYRLDPERVGVVPLGVDAAFRRAGAAAVGGAPTGGAAAAGAAAAPDSPASPEPPGALPPGVSTPYLLYLGTLLERRNVPLLLEVFARLRRERPELSLVLAGADRLRRRGGLEGLLDGAGAGVTHLGYVPEAAVVPLYRRAELSFYLSEYEGFGLPPLESLAAGTPAVVGPGLALDALWPGYAYRCSALDAEEVTRVAAAALADPAARRRVAAEGVARMAELTWRRSAERFLDELERALP
jgi:glycosyltransferase involved in cell wall biosynthesis